MGDVGDYWREHREHKRKAALYRTPCPCGKSDLWPGQKCKHCGYRNPRDKKAEQEEKEK